MTHIRCIVLFVEVAGTGILKEDVTFKDDLFPAGIPTRGTYRFNTYRLTYRRTFHGSGA